MNTFLLAGSLVPTPDPAAGLSPELRRYASSEGIDPASLRAPRRARRPWRRPLHRGTTAVRTLGRPDPAACCSVVG